MRKHNITSDYLMYEQHLEQLAAALDKTMDAVFNEMIAHLEAQLFSIVQHGEKTAPDLDQGQKQAEWLQTGNGQSFGPYNTVRLRGEGASFSEMIVEGRNQT